MKKTKKQLCINCGKRGHEFKSCMDPITSFGIIDIKILDDDSKSDLFRTKFSTKKNISYILTSYKYNNIQCNIADGIKIMNDNNYKIDNECIKCDNSINMRKFFYYKNKILFLMVSRKFSIGFVEFIRGKYQVHDSHTIIRLFEQMTVSEITFIHNSACYDDILYYFLNNNNLMEKSDILNKVYRGKYANEYCESKIKFETLLNSDDQIPWNLHFYTKTVKPKWKNVEWGFPKGRRETNTEENLCCARREFEEETGMNNNDYQILDKVEPIDEYLVGTNNVSYKHVYYLGISSDNVYHSHIHTNNETTSKNNSNKPCSKYEGIMPSLSKTDIGSSSYDTQEIGEVKWFTFDDAMNNIRPYHVGKKSVLTKIYMFIINYLMLHDDNAIDFCILSGS